MWNASVRDTRSGRYTKTDLGLNAVITTLQLIKPTCLKLIRHGADDYTRTSPFAAPFVNAGSKHVGSISKRSLKTVVSTFFLKLLFRVINLCSEPKCRTMPVFRLVSYVSV